MRKITAIIPTYNEAHNIEAAIDSVSWADELLVVDSFSKDKTVDIAAAKGAKIIQRVYINSASQKNWAIPQASHEWIVLLDADERIEPDLRDEIQALLKSDNIPCDAYWINRRNHFMGKEVKYSGWQGDRVIRFFKRDTCSYEYKEVHAEVITEGTIGKLKNKISHFTYKDMDHFLAKMDKYAVWSAKDHLESTPVVTPFHRWIKPAARFFKHFILQGGFLDGKVGYTISKVMAYGVRQRYVKIKEMHDEMDF